MGLNLNALKNLPPTGTTESTREENVLSVKMEDPSKTIIVENTEVLQDPVLVEEKTPVALSSGPKISLIKLKKASGIESTPPAPVEALATEERPVAEIEKEILSQESWATPVIAQEADIVSPIFTIGSETREEVPETPLISIETISIDLSEGRSESISIMESTQEQKQTEAPLVVEEPKEFFPNFHIADAMKLDNDLIDLEDLITIKEHTEEPETTLPIELSGTEVTNIIAIEESIINIEPTKEVSINTIEEEITSTETPPLSAMEQEGSINASPAITPEYVAEVKTELSEQRRAGFRFFIQNKTKIMAGLGITLSVSAVVFLSNSFMPTDIENVGKSNVQEGQSTVRQEDTETMTMPTKETEDIVVTPPENPATTTENTTAPTTTSETPGYEIGKDYNVTKNTKKNVRSKATINTASGTEIPTP